MWEQDNFENAGGFYESEAPADTPGGSQKRRQRVQNLVPVFVKDIIESGEEGLPENRVGRCWSDSSRWQDCDRGAYRHQVNLRYPRCYGNSRGCTLDRRGHK